MTAQPALGKHTALVSLQGRTSVEGDGDGEGMREEVVVGRRG